MARAFVAFVAVLIVLLVALLVMTSTPDDTPGEMLRSGQSSTATPELDPYAQPIFDRQDAISRTMASVPATVTVEAMTVKLVSTTTLASEWYGDDDTSWLSDTPIWLVVFRTTGVALRDAIQIAGGASVVNDPSVIPGAFFAWDANSGDLVGSGALRPPPTPEPSRTPGGPSVPTAHWAYEFDYADAEALVDEVLVIEQATVIPEPTEQ